MTQTLWRLLTEAKTVIRGRQLYTTLSSYQVSFRVSVSLGRRSFMAVTLPWRVVSTSYSISQTVTESGNISLSVMKRALHCPLEGYSVGLSVISVKFFCIFLQWWSECLAIHSFFSLKSDLSVIAFVPYFHMRCPRIVDKPSFKKDTKCNTKI